MMTDSCKAFSSSIILAYTEDLLAAEDGLTAASRAQRKRLRRIIGEVVKATDYYLPADGFCLEDVMKAVKAVDYINEYIDAIYGTPPEAEACPEHAA